MTEKTPEEKEEVVGPEKIELNMTIEGPLARRLETIKRYYGLQRYTEAVRVLITVEYERIKPLST
jgi:hypothetical protein